jgi:signal transduction histidine kinase
LAERTSKEFGIRVKCDFDDSACVIDQQTMHDVRMIAREALYNALVHSSAKVIEISARNESGEMAFTIRDNGKGFDPSQVSFENHYGLTGMQERVDRLGGSFVLNTSIGKGTTVHFRIPATFRETVERV